MVREYSLEGITLYHKLGPLQNMLCVVSLILDDLRIPISLDLVDIVRRTLIKDRS